MNPPDDASPTRRPRIETEHELARGGMSSIRCVRDSVLGRRMAMKVLDVSQPHPQLRPRFLREAQLLAQLDHPHIVPLYELGVDDEGVPCFTMKLVLGRTFAEVVGEADVLGHPVELARIVDIVARVCDAIAFANSRGVIHRDLKPDNVMVGSHGQVYVMDWGIAHVLLDAQLAEAGVRADRRVVCDGSLDAGTGGLIGTPASMAPEQALGREDEIDARTDVYGIGGLLYFVLTGRSPHSAADVGTEILRARAGKVRPPEEVVPDPLPRGLCGIAMRALAPDRAARYPSVDALKLDLDRFLQGGVFQTQRFAAGTTIVRQHEAGDAAYIITQGHCEVVKTEAGRKVVLRRMGPGQVFGETAILTGQPRTATVVAIDDVAALTVTRDSLEEGLALDSWVGALVRSLAGRFNDLDGQLTALRRAHLKLQVRERILTAVAAHGRARWSPLCAALVAETGLAELDLLAIAADSDDLALDEARDVIAVTGRG